MSRKELLQSKHKGFAIAATICALLILSIMSIALSGLGLQSRLLSQKKAAEIIVDCAANAGITMALFEMNLKLNDKPWDDSTLPQAIDQTLENCDATFTYIVTGDLDIGYTIQSVGQYGNSRQVRQVIATLRTKGPFDYALFAEERITLKNSSVVDWYNQIEDDDKLRIGTNATSPEAVNIHLGAAVNGDVVIGVDGLPGDFVDIEETAITGEVLAMTKEFRLSAVTVPDWVQALPGQGQIGNTTTISTSGKYSSIDIKNGDAITIDEPVTIFVTGDVRLKNSAELRIDTSSNSNASLKLYVGGDINMDNSSVTNTSSQNPKKLRIYAIDTCDSITFKNSAVFYGVIYAPSATVLFDNSAKGYGAVVANEVELKNSSHFGFDGSLTEEGTVDDELVRFVVKRWSEW